MEDVKFIEKIEVEYLDMNESTPEEDKVRYLFKLLVNNYIDKENNNLEMKLTKKDVKEKGFEPARLVEALKYLKDEINKKMEQAEVIEDYMATLQENADDNKFEGLDLEVQKLLDAVDEIKEGSKNIKDRASEVGVDFKAINELAKNHFKSINPNQREKKPDIVLEGVIEEYTKIVKRD